MFFKLPETDIFHHKNRSNHKKKTGNASSFNRPFLRGENTPSFSSGGHNYTSNDIGMKKIAKDPLVRVRPGEQQAETALGDLKEIQLNTNGWMDDDGCI